MRILSPEFVHSFNGRIMNVHPSLLPSFPGAHAVRDALAYGVRVTGVTVHLVDDLHVAADSGPIVVQEALEVSYDDRPEDVTDRLHEIEHRLLPRAVRLFLCRPDRSGGPECAREGRAAGMKIRRALISVSDKNGLATFASGLSELGVELISTSGTAQLLADSGLAVTTVEQLTGSPELLGGRVKTLHPHIHAAILARRNHPDDMASLEAQGVVPIDMVVCNLYPFRHVANRRGVSEPEVIANIDVGGPTMVRAAAKNFDSVAVVTDPERYGFLLDELRSGGGELSPDTHRELAAEAFAHTAGYDAAISEWSSETEPFPERVVLDLVKAGDLAYGENPHQRAAYYVEAGARRHLLSMIEQLGGRPLSFDNLADLQAARGIAASFQLPACAIVKHANPCGVAVGATLEEAYERALESDPMSAFGAVIAVNRPVSAALGERLAEQFVEVLFAPGYDPAAVETLRGKADLRILEDRERRKASPGERDLRRVLGGILIQDRDTELDDRSTCRSSGPPIPGSRSGAICCSPGGSASTSIRTRS